jgi:hypothetical protein
MFDRVESQKTFRIAADDGCGGNHFRIKVRARRQQAEEIAAMTIGPVHHRGNGDSGLS